MSSAPHNEREVKLLLVFDFDHSLIEENSDLYVIKLSPGGKLPDEIQRLYRDDGWTKYMGEIFKYLHSSGQPPESILNCLSEIPLTVGMKELIDFTTGTNKVDHIVISDANSVFIEHILETKGLKSKMLATFTNPGQFGADGCLRIKEYHLQDWCRLSTVNLCKGQILKDFISKRFDQGVTYKHIIYVGDGYNDLCPGLTLRPEDVLMPRVGFKLQNLIENMSSRNEPVPRENLKASVIPWSSGLDVLKYIKELGFLSENQEM